MTGRYILDNTSDYSDEIRLCYTQILKIVNLNTFKNTAATSNLTLDFNYSIQAANQQRITKERIDTPLKL